MSIHFPKVGHKEPKAIGLMGGTFDPIHIGHLVTAEEARQQFNLDCVIFIPAGNPPHKNSSKLTDREHRYLMTLLAVANNPYFTLSRIELDKEEPSYTIDTVREFYQKFQGKAKIYFITGADAVLDIITWKDYRELLSMCSFIAATRPGYSLTKLKVLLGPAFSEIIPRIHLLEIPAMAISSTYLRRKVAAGKTIKYLTPASVEQYIYKNRLYHQE
ncbi:MAG: nicotinate-nucleotide adenylyltransferase [Firmicutes bacterium]|nr:nicotinate-nucleotide adenylyltransferase [Bacillota bacterium]